MSENIVYEKPDFYGIIENPLKLHANREPSRSFYIPYKCRCEAIGGNRSRGGRYKNLNGDWDFYYFTSVYAAEDALAAGLCGSTCKKIKVPSNWQMYGYDIPQYVNSDYPIPFDPPYVPDESPAGIYRRSFVLPETWREMDIYINFDGVDTMFFLWINGTFIGMSQGAHLPSEFYIGGALRQGKNDITVMVCKWAWSTYLEDQDKYRLSGIFRTVCLTARPKKHIRDIFIKYKLKFDGEKCVSAELTAELDFIGGVSAVAAELYDDNFDITESCEAQIGERSGIVFMTVQNPVLWNAEKPYLYTLLLLCEGEVLPVKVGFREIELADTGELIINKKSVKLKGVNRHDTDCDRGYYTPYEVMKSEMLLMKRHNINTIRTSHYPNAPEFPRTVRRAWLLCGG